MNINLADYMTYYKAGASIILFVVLLSCCSGGNDEREIKRRATAFSEEYFSWHLDKAAVYCTETSRKWLRMVASNIDSADVSMLNETDVEVDCRVKDIIWGGDSSAYVVVEVRDFLAFDSIGGRLRVVESEAYTVPLMHNGGLWSVNLQSPLRPQRKPNL